MESPRGSTTQAQSVRHPPINLAEGESVMIGDLELTIASVEADEVRIELRDQSGHFDLVETEDGCVELVTR